MDKMENEVTKQVVWNLEPSAFEAKYIIVRDHGDGVLWWSRFSSDDYERTKNCVDYGNSIPNLPYKKFMLETKNVVPAADFKNLYPEYFKRLGFKCVGLE